MPDLGCNTFLWTYLLQGQEFAERAAPRATQAAKDAVRDAQSAGQKVGQAAEQSLTGAGPDSGDIVFATSSACNSVEEDDVGTYFQSTCRMWRKKVAPPGIKRLPLYFFAREHNHVDVYPM